jgi:hypothetical protein
MIVQRGRPISFRKSSAGRDEVLDEQVGLILTRPVAGRDPRVTTGENVVADRGRRHRARPRTSLDPVREHDETAAPARRHFDEVVGAAEHAAPADRRGRRLGPRRVEPRTGDQEREIKRERAGVPLP